MTDSTILQGPASWYRDNVAPLPRRHFGLREPALGDLPNGFFRALDVACGERPEDRRQQEQAKRIARAARAAKDAANGLSRANDAQVARLLSDALDELSALAASRKSVRFALIAQDIASISERCSLIEAEAKP